MNSSGHYNKHVVDNVFETWYPQRKTIKGAFDFKNCGTSAEEVSPFFVESLWTSSNNGNQLGCMMGRGLKCSLQGIVSPTELQTPTLWSPSHLVVFAGLCSMFSLPSALEAVRKTGNLEAARKLLGRWKLVFLPNAGRAFALGDQAGSSSRDIVFTWLPLPLLDII